MQRVWMERVRSCKPPGALSPLTNFFGSFQDKQACAEHVTTEDQDLLRHPFFASTFYPRAVLAKDANIHGPPLARAHALPTNLYELT